MASGRTHLVGLHLHVLHLVPVLLLKSHALGIEVINQTYQRVLEKDQALAVDSRIARQAINVSLELTEPTSEGIVVGFDEARITDTTGCPILLRNHLLAHGPLLTPEDAESAFQIIP